MFRSKAVVDVHHGQTVCLDQAPHRSGVELWLSKDEASSMKIDEQRARSAIRCRLVHDAGDLISIPCRDCDPLLLNILWRPRCGKDILFADSLAHVRSEVRHSQITNW